VIQGTDAASSRLGKNNQRFHFAILRLADQRLLLEEVTASEHMAILKSCVHRDADSA